MNRSPAAKAVNNALWLAANTVRIGICVNAAMSPGKTQRAISSVTST